MKRKTAISKKQGKFLNEFLKTKSLEDLLPLYIAAISNNAEIFKILPEELTAQVRKSLRNFQTAIGIPEKSDQTDFPHDKILRNLQALDGTALL